MISTLRDPELAAVPVGTVEFSNAPTMPGTLAAAAASRAFTLSILFVTAFLRAWVRA